MIQTVNTRSYRRMGRDYCLPWTGRAALVAALLLVCIALWVVAPPALADAQYTVTVDDWCNVRALPDKSSEDEGDLYAGDTVTGTGYQDGWVQVRTSVEAGTGWVRADLLTLADYPTGRYSNTSGGRVNIRKTPYVNDDNHAHWLDAGHSVEVERWVDVSGTAWAYTNRGYVDGGYLEAAE